MQFLRAALLTACALAVLLTWALLGRQATNNLRDRDRLGVAFAAIECNPPDGQSRADFLSEVQYLSGLPDHLPLPDEELAGRLAAAFAAHPRVESVERVEVIAPRIQVRLVYRNAVLAISVEGGLRAVDARGGLLPHSVSIAGLPRLACPSGAIPDLTRGDDRIVVAARTAAYTRPYRSQATVEQIVVEGDDIVLEFASGGHVRWGRAPGREKPGESNAASKALRLREAIERGALAQGEIDLTTTQEKKRQ